MALAASVALVQPERRVEQPVERIVLLLDEQVVRQLARREQLERARRSRRASYTNAPVITSSFSRMRFGSNFGRAMPAPTSTSVPAALELRERRLLRAAVARALERDVEGLVDEVVRHCGRRRAPRASTVRAPSFSHSARRFSLRLAHDDVVDAERLQRGDRQEADRAAAGDEPARAGPGAAALGDAVQRDRERLGRARRA